MKKNRHGLCRFIWIGLVALLINTNLYAATPVWTYSASTPTEISISDGKTATVQYTVTNQSTKPKNLFLKSTPGLSASPCYLAGKGSTCVLTLTIDGSQLPPQGLHTGPIMCEQSNANQCYQPSRPNSLHITNVR